MLRTASYGGATVFWPGSARDEAASKSFGEDPPLALDYASVDAARARAQRATAILSALSGVPIVFDIGEPTIDHPEGATVLADAIARSAKALAKVASDPTGARVIAKRVNRVEFREATAPAFFFNSGVLTIEYNPAGDVEGRPGSAAIVRFLEKSL